MVNDDKLDDWKLMMCEKMYPLWVPNGCKKCKEENEGQASYGCGGRYAIR